MAQKHLKFYKKANARRDLPRRLKADSKVQGGKVAIIAGSPGMWGAALLAAQGASRSGAGYVYLPPSTRENFLKHPDFLNLTEVQMKKQTFSAVVLGPGYRFPSVIAKWIRHWKKVRQQNVVLDAEALNWLAKNPDEKIPPSWVLTPHEGEMGRLLNRSRAWVHEHRQEAVMMAQKKWHCIVLLKGPQTLVTDGQSIYQVKAGNAALGKAGSGDVLAGMIAAFLAQTPQASLLQSVSAAAFVHGWIADQWLKKRKDILSLRPVDLLSELPQALASLRK